MTKNKGLAISVLGIILVVFNVVAFIAPFEHTTSFWVCYGFTMLAIIVQGFVVNLAIGKADTMKSKFIGFSIIYIGYIYLVVQLVLSLLFMTITAIPIFVSVIVQIIVLCISAVCLIAVEIGRDEINRVEQKVKEKVLFIKSRLIDVECLLSKTDNALVKKKLTDLIDIVKYSDPMSNDSLKPLESKIEEKLAELAEAVETGDNGLAGGIADEVKDLFEQRNKKCKLLK